mgnify:CR=1 FL=1
MKTMTNKELAEYYASLPEDETAWFVVANDDAGWVSNYPVNRMDERCASFDGDDVKVGVPMVMEKY